MLSTLVGDLHGEQMAPTFQKHFSHPPLLDTPATTTPAPAQLELLLPPLGKTKVAVAAEDPKDRGPHVRQVVEDDRALAAIERKRVRRVHLIVQLGIEVRCPIPLDRAVCLVVRPQRPEEREHLLVLRRRQRHLAGILTIVIREQRSGRVANRMGDPRVEHARVPRRVELGAPERRLGLGARRPGLAPEGRRARGAHAGPHPPEREVGDDGVEQHQGGEQPRVQQRQVGQDVAAERVADADEGARHLRAEHVRHVQQVARVVVPARVVAQEVLVEGAAAPLVRHVGDPDPADPEPPGLPLMGARVELGPHRLVQLLGEPVRVRSDDRHVARLRVRVVQRDVLLDVDVQHVFLGVARRPRPFPYVLCRYGVFFDLEWERHGYHVLNVFLWLRDKKLRYWENGGDEASYKIRDKKADLVELKCNLELLALCYVMLCKSCQ